MGERGNIKRVRREIRERIKRETDSVRRLQMITAMRDAGAISQEDAKRLVYG